MTDRAQSPRVFLSPPHMGGQEQRYIAEAFEINFIAPVGPHLSRFEELFAETVGVKHALALSSGTAALHLTLRYLELEPGDEVLCSTFTFCASANPIRYERAAPVFIDSDWGTWNMDPNLVADELRDADKKGKLPKAIIVVDILGQSADIGAINEVADRYGVAVIEDAAESLGSTYRGQPAGSAAWCSTFSLNGNKIITTSSGGVLCSDDEAFIDRARFLATQAREPASHYEHHTYGYNYRMSNVLAGIGLGQLEVLSRWVDARRHNYAEYTKGLRHVPGITFAPMADYGDSNCWLTAILVDPKVFGADCEALRIHLEGHNIESRRAWKPMHRQPSFVDCRVRGGAVSDEIFEKGLCLPSGSSLTDADRERVVSAIKNCAIKNCAIKNGPIKNGPIKNGPAKLS